MHLTEVIGRSSAEFGSCHRHSKAAKSVTMSFRRSSAIAPSSLGVAKNCGNAYLLVLR